MALATADAVVLELMTMGQQSAAHLGDLLRAASPASSPPGELHQQLAAEVLRCCGRVIAALRASSTGGRGQKRKAAEHEDAAAPAAAATSSPPTMPPSKRRSRGEAAVKEVTSGTTVDGFIWRKYGQKDINGHKHPRLYYRCAYKHQGCAATRRVQRTQDEPAPAYEIAYYGEHTCRGATAACQAAPAPPAVVDFGSNAWSAPAASEQQRWSWDGEASQGGWSSASASSEAEFDAQAHGWPDMVEEPSATTCDDASPVMEFLDSCFDWDSIINDPFDFGVDLQQVATLQ